MPNDYQQFALSIESHHALPTDRRFSRLMHAGLGICTEAGEFQDALKKHFAYGAELDLENLQEELGDLLWYIAIAADALGADLTAVMAANRRKLEKRYPRGGFTAGDATARADKAGA